MNEHSQTQTKTDDPSPSLPPVTVAEIRDIPQRPTADFLDYAPCLIRRIMRDDRIDAIERGHLLMATRTEVEQIFRRSFPGLSEMGIERFTNGWMWERIQVFVFKTRVTEC